LSEKGWEEGWIRGEAVDPTGKVAPGEVPGFWFEHELEGLADGLKRKRREGNVAGPDERVVLYLVGGGYCYGRRRVFLFQTTLADRSK
jgi:hypothetical protein